MSCEMESRELSDYLFTSGCCKYCVLRYLKPKFEEFSNVDESLKKRGISSDDSESNEKKKKLNPCVTCYGLFDKISSVIEQIKQDENLIKYKDVDKFITSFSLPVLLDLTQLQMWLALLAKFPDNFNKEKVPDLSVKDVIKNILNDRIEVELKRDFDVDGLMIGLTYSIENENEIMKQLDDVAPELMTDRNKQKKKYRTEVVSRNYFGKHFTPKNIDVEKFQKLIPIPPEVPTSSIQLEKIIFTGPTVFCAGRYQKFSRKLSQTPWVLNGKRMSEGSVEETIITVVAPYFNVSDKEVTFMGSGREDVDVRCLGRGRPFALELQNATKTTLDPQLASEIEQKINASGIVSIRDFQMVKRDDLRHIKSGEENKKKIYRALCTLRENIVTEDIMERLNLSNKPFDIQQWTPIRVLHRRTLLKRPRTIYSVKPFAVKDNPNLIVLDIITQAGTYVKELVHGEFGRTEPSISSLIDMDIDIISLDVMNIDLDFPPSLVERRSK